MKKLLSIMLICVIALMMTGCVFDEEETTVEETTVEEVNTIWEERIESLDFLIVEVVRRYDGVNLEYNYYVKYFDNNNISFYIESDNLLSVGEIGLVIEFEDETSILIDID